MLVKFYFQSETASGDPLFREVAGIDAFEIPTGTGPLDRTEFVTERFHELVSVNPDLPNLYAFSKIAGGITSGSLIAAEVIRDYALQKRQIRCLFE